MKKALLSLFLVLATALSLSAQSLTGYKWNQHGISFKVPAGATIITNDSEIFEVDDDNFNVKLEVVKDYGITPEELGEYIVELASEAGLKVDSSTEIQSFDGTGCWGISIEGDRKTDSICCAFIVSTKSDLVVYVKVIYGRGFEQEANDIINSIKMTK